ncbi:MAG: aspartate ammonia-lyase, partial [Anaerococcus vaginalis]
MTKFRREHDSVGEMDILENAYYGANAKRAEENFPITGLKADDKFLDAMVEVKKAAAFENEKLDLISKEQKDAIVYACDKILAGEYRDNFIVDPIQGGAGTSYNMNANEIIANIANEKLGGGLGVYDKVHPNDDVNKGQSTNDVIPTSGKIALVRYFIELKDECEKLLKSFEKKADEFKDVYKMGRTQLQDAVPISLGQEFNAYHSVIKRDYKRIQKAIDELSNVNLGATAIGTGLNADRTYVKEIVGVLKDVTGLDLKQAEDLVDGTQNLDGFLYASSILKTFAVSLSKISNDLRLMSSGPQTGIGDINLPVRQAGSSIMPGKVNPVIPEVVSQVAFAVCGNDTTV